MKCPKCKATAEGGVPSESGKGNIGVKKTKRGKIFYGCDTYPACDFAAWDKPINEFCPTCNSILTKTIKGAIKCSNKDCDYKRNADADPKTDQ